MEILARLVEEAAHVYRSLADSENVRLRAFAPDAFALWYKLEAELTKEERG